MTKRRKAKNPSLKKELNLKSRIDYIETEYIDGVYDEKGNQLIRPLNEEEKAWLDKFYSESVGAAFSKSDNIHKTLSKEEKNRLKKRIKQLRERVSELRKDYNGHILRLKEIKVEVSKIQEDIEKINKNNGTKICYDANNQRNRCVFNKAKITNNLVPLRDNLHPDCYIDWELVMFHEANLD